MASSMSPRLSTRFSKTHAHQHLVGGRAKNAENYPIELIVEILRGMRDTADFEEQWGDETEASLGQAMATASLFHSPKFSSLVAAYRAKDLEEETRNMTMKFKYLNGDLGKTHLQFKVSYKDEYTCEELPMGHVRK